ncbi:MAG TPA: hypothetical protein VLS90_19125 [Thermodesulfobacteriota bacterium]|nr:hypothetical protein [Thermodesulfobacteriota bacterium]
MKKLVCVVIAAAFLLSTGALALAQKPAVKKEAAVKATAIVQAIDMKTRVVTLKDADGNVFDLKVGEEARNLGQVKVGDKVTTTYYESIALQVKKPGGPQGAVAGQVVERAKPGEQPGGAIVNTVVVIATVDKIDPKKEYVILKGPQGNKVQLKVQDKKNLENVKVGDQVEVTHTEAFAIAVEKQ